MEPGPDNAERGVELPVRQKRVVLESLALLLLSLGTVGTAWCSFQAAAWGGASQGLMNRSTALSRQAVVSELQSYQMALVDVMLFSEYINARAGSNQPLANFYAERFRDEAKTAFQAWMATQPFQNCNAPPHPFVTNFYRPRLLRQAESVEAQSQSYSQQAGNAGRISRSYVLITVVLASALFCAGTAGKFESVGVRRSVLALGLAAFGFAGLRLLSLPLQF